ncbi:transcriptional regulator [Rhizobium sp. TH2]|nr:transcriptional regulator [Rhizobium sp. TH2]
MSDEEVEANARSDIDNPPSPHGAVPQGRMARAQVIRRALHLTQEEFSARYHIPLGTLRDWEQHRAEPDQAARAYLKVIAKDPDFVATALADGKPAAAAE